MSEKEKGFTREELSRAVDKKWQEETRKENIPETDFERKKKKIEQGIKKADQLLIEKSEASGIPVKELLSDPRKYQEWSGGVYERQFGGFKSEKLKEIYGALASLIKSYGHEDPTGLFLEIDPLKINYQKTPAFVRLFYLIPRIQHDDSLKEMVRAIVGKLEEKKLLPGTKIPFPTDLMLFKDGSAEAGTTEASSLEVQDDSLVLEEYAEALLQALQNKVK